MPKAIAIGISDLHLSLQKPACRADKDWMAVQAGYLKQVCDLAERLGDVPVLCAGDIFDKWNAPAELINFALDHLPTDMICIPGQHDLPEHRIEGVGRSAFGTLVAAGAVRDITASYLIQKGFTAYGAAWGCHFVGEPIEGFGLHIGITHRYLWDKDVGYPGAPESGLIKNQPDFEGYDFILSGDNHKYFEVLGTRRPRIYNPGTFIRRKSDEIDHVPSIAVFNRDGTMSQFLLNTEGDKFHYHVKDQPQQPINMREFINQLENLGEHGLNFQEEVKRYLENNEVDEQTRQIILRTIEQQSK